MPRDPATLDHFAILLRGKREPVGYVPALNEADAVQRYIETAPLALGYKDMLTAHKTTRRG